jgi:predicted ATP-dependent protease
VTGSINQKGDIQPIGGVNHKVEGFYDTCVSRGLSGRQGVLIPRSNQDDLMVRKDIAEAAAAGMFHVYAVDTIGEVLEILSGRPAGAFKEGEGYAEESVLGRANARLLRLAEEIRPFGPADAG